MDGDVAVEGDSSGNGDSGSGNVAGNGGEHWNLDSTIHCRRVVVTAVAVGSGHVQSCDNG